MEIQRHLTAISSKRPSAPTTWAYQQGYLRDVIYDYGAGRGRDTNWLQGLGLQVYSYDPYYGFSKPLNKDGLKTISCVLINYVCNVIEDPVERSDILKTLSDNCKPDTLIIVSVRTQKEIKDKSQKGAWTAYGDGYITSRGTFQKGYTPLELAGLLKKAGNIVSIVQLHSGGLVGCVKVP